MMLNDLIKNNKVDIEKCYQILRDNRIDESGWWWAGNDTDEPTKVFWHKNKISFQPPKDFEISYGIKGISKDWIIALGIIH